MCHVVVFKSLLLTNLTDVEKLLFVGVLSVGHDMKLFTFVQHYKTFDYEKTITIDSWIGLWECPVCPI
jgi:hypothetical protein